MWHDKDGEEFASNKGLNYGGTIGLIPIMAPTPGYTGDFFMSGAKVTSSMIVNFSQSIMHAYYQEKARNIPITWDGNGGFFPDGEETTHTLTTFNQNYVMPPEVVRPGYIFDGWYLGLNPNDSSAKPLSDIGKKFVNVNYDTFHARWKLRDNLTVKIFADEKLTDLNLGVVNQEMSISNNYTWLQVTQNYQNRFSNVYGCTEFVFSDMEFDAGWVFHKFSIKNTATGLVATEGYDYKIEQSGDTYTIFAFESIEITINSCIRAEIKAVSNFNDGKYEVNQHGGLVSVNSGEYLPETYIDVQYNDSIQLSAKKVGTNVEFLGYYSSFDPNTGVSGKIPLSPRGQLDWTSGGLKESGEIYAVFYFKHYEVNVYAYSSTLNFEDKTGLSVGGFDEVGGKVAVKHNNVNQEASSFSYSGHANIKVADGYYYAVSAMINTSSQARTEYRYVGMYYSLQALLADKTNSNPDIPSSKTILSKERIDGKNVNLYAKFVLVYEFKVIAADEGGVSITLGDNSATKELKKSYYYGEYIDRVSNSVDSRYYEPASPAWKVVSGSLLGVNSQKNLNAVLNSQTISEQKIKMPDQPIEIKAQVVRKFFDLTVFAIYADMNMYEFSARGGTANITTSDSTKVKFESNNGVMGLSYSVTAKVEYKSDAITLVPVLNTNFDYATQFRFVGWYDSFEGFDLLGERLDNPDGDGKYHVESMKDGMTFYCAFAKSYYVQVSVDDRVRDVVFEGLEKEQETNPLTGITRYFTYSNYASQVHFELIKERGEIDKFYQTQGGPDVALSSDETKTLYSFTMPNYPVYIEITTKGNKFYALTLRAVLVDDMQALYDDDEGFETEVGDVRAKEVDKVGTTVAMQVEETRTRTLLATPGVGYSFFGWYKLRTDVSFTKIMKEGAPSYTENIDSWLNIYNPTTNPNGAYVYFGSEEQVVSDPIERSNKNLYVAVFVKNYTISLIKGDRGIEELGYEVVSPYDRNADGENDNLNAEINDQGSTVTITVPYGSEFEVWSKIRENYTFAYYDIIAGKPNLSHYPITGNKILPDEEFVLENEDYSLNFYLYDNIKLISKTDTIFKTATVNVYTLDTKQVPVLSMEGGTFNMASSQAQSFDIIIGTSLTGFIKVNPGFVFSHFEVNGEEAAHNVGMPAEDCDINVYFARNAYILNTYIKTIGDDGILADNENGGIVEVNHSILYGDKNTLSLTASMGYVLDGIYIDENCKILAPNFESQIDASERIEDYQFYYSYTTEVLDVIPESPKIPAFNFYIVYKFLLFDIEEKAERKELNTNQESQMPDGAFDVFDDTTNLALTKGYYGEKIVVDLPQSEELRYYNSYVLTVYDKTNDANVELFYSFEEDSVEVTENGLNCLSDGITAYFIMPLGEIEIKLYATYHEMNIILDSFSNTGTFDNEYVQAGPTGYAEISVFYGYNNYVVKEGTELKLDVLLSGVPYATKKGFKLVAYNTEKDRSGTDFITYQYDGDDEVIGVTRNDFIFDETPINFGEIITLYAIYDYANIDMHLNYCLSGEEFYNGSMQALMQIDVYNYNPEIPYIYTWYDKNNNLIGRYDFKANKFFNAQDVEIIDTDFVISKTTNDDKVINILQLRSVNQSGTYTCVVSILGGALFEEKQISVQENKFITIMPIDIGVNIASSTPYYGATMLEVTNSNTYGLLPMHMISGTVGMTTPGVYNNTNRPDIVFTVENTALSYEKGYKVTVQDGAPIASNYTVSFEGECEIIEPAGLVTVNSGVYFRSVDMASNNEVFGNVASTELQVTSMLYSEFVQPESKAFYGKLTNFVDKTQIDDFGKTITLVFDKSHDYGFYKLYVNDTEITTYTLNDTTLSFDLSYDYINADNIIDIKVYLTNDCLVTAVYNVDGVEDYVSRQVYNDEFKTPPAVEGKLGYVFEGWYFDEDCTKNVPQVWQVWGTQTIYANWTLVDISGYITIVVTDNGQEVELDENSTYTKTYDANNVALDVKIGIEGFTGTANWFKKDRFASWISATNVAELKNVADSGEYTFEITVVGPDGKTQTITYGKYIAKLVINPYALTLEDGIFDKTYDGNTALSRQVLVNGVTGQLEVTGQFAFKDVAIEDDEVANIEIINVKILNYGTEIGANYAVANENVYGKINPKEVFILAQKEKVYNGAVYSEIHEQTLTNPMEVMTYKLESLGANAGLYEIEDGLRLQPLTVASYLTNYDFKLDENSYVKINKANHVFEFVNKSVIFDGNNHKLEVMADGQPVSEFTQGVREISYTYDAVANTDGVINAGTYLVKAKVVPDDNFEPWEGQAYLTIQKLGFTLTITMQNGDRVEDKIYSGQDFYNSFKFETNLSEQMNALLNLRPYITKANVEVLEVKNVGSYKISAEFNETNFAVSGQGYTYFNVIAEALNLENIFKSTPLNYTFNGLDQKADIIDDALVSASSKDLCTFNIQTIAKQDATGMFLSTGKVLRDAGNYQVKILAEVKDESSFTLANGNYEEIILEVVVTPFRITSTNIISVSATKEYDGKTEFKSGAIEINLGKTPYQIESISGEFEDANAGESKAIKNNFKLGNEDNYIIDSSVYTSSILKGEILQKEVSVKLLKSGNFVSALYTDNFVIKIERTLNQQYVSGLIDGEYLETNIVCNASEAGQYPLSDEDVVNVAYLDWSSSNTKIVLKDGTYGVLSNYKLGEFTGGLNLIAQKQIVADVVLNGFADGQEFDNIYTGTQKGIFVKFNEILAKYVLNGTSSKFEPVDSTQELPAEITLLVSKDNPQILSSGYVDAKSYTLTFKIVSTSTDFTSFVGGEELGDGSKILELVNEYVIVPFEISTSITKTIEYGDDLTTVTGSAVPTIDTSKTIEYRVDLTNIPYNLAPRTDTYDYTYTQGNGVTVLTSDITFTNNYTLKVTVQVSVLTKKFIVSSSNYASLPYNLSNQKATYDQNQPTLTPASGTGAANQNLYSVKYYFNYVGENNSITKVETDEIKNVGLYSAVLYADYYQFKLEGADDSTYQNHLDLGSFEITKGILTAEFYGEREVGYNKQYQTPAKVKFFLGQTEISNLLHTITYSNGVNQNLLGIRDAGVYTAHVEVTSDNFELAPQALDNEFTVSKYKFTIENPKAGEVWFSKYYGQADPEFVKTFTTEFSDELKIKFTREKPTNYEAVSTYKLSNPEFVEVYPNYTLDAGFVDNFGAFHILSYKDVGIQITITMLKNISLEYDGAYHSTIEINNFEEYFSVSNADGIADPSSYDISIVFGVEGNPARNVGEYKLEFVSVASTTHRAEDILLDLKNFRFVITKKLLTFNVDSITKVYDGTTNAEFTDVALNGICDSDIGTLKLQGTFDNKNIGQNKSVNVTLIGENAGNYSFETQTTTGSITARYVLIEGELVKEYDGTDVVNTSGLTITNVCEGDTINLTGKYNNKSVAISKEITFELNNDNYTLGSDEYLGAILVKQLQFAGENPGQEFSKEYDGNANANIENTDLVGIVEGDDVVILSAVYVDKITMTANPTEGNKFLVITLGGADKNNYAISNLATSITERYVTIQYHYGDETGDGAYTVTFVNDGQAITDKQDKEQKVRYGFKIVYNFNELNKLAEPNRVGYNFMGWTLDKENTKKFTDTSNTNLVSIDILNQNGSILDLYAVWQIKTFALWAQVFTQNANNDDYAETTLGGTYKINGQEVKGKLTLEYFTEITLEAFVNENFEFVDISREDATISSAPTFTERVNKDSVFNIKFDRKILTLKINVGTYNPTGYDSSIWAKQGNLLVSMQKYMTTVKLPTLSVYGYDFMGFATTASETLAAASLVTFETDNTVLTAKFTPKEIDIIVDTAGGLGDESFEYVDKDKKSIIVTFGQKIGNLPLLAKQGYVFGGFTLYNVLGIVSDVTSQSILTTAESGLVIKANWEAANNTFALSGQADISSYTNFGITEYQTYNLEYQFYYNLGQDTTYTLYTAEFQAETESTVRIKLGKTSINGFKFAYWQVQNQIVKVLEEGESPLTIDSATFKLVEDINGAYILEIQGFVWENMAPEIVAVFVPETYVIYVNEFNENYGAVEVTNGAKALENGTYLTMAGAKVVVSYTEKTGYAINLDKTRFEGALAAHNEELNTFTLTDITTNVVIDIQFTKSKFTFGVEKQGASEGIAYIKYSINSEAFENYNMKTLLKTEDILQLQIGLKFGYTLQTTINNPNITLVEDAVNPINANLTDYFYTISGFVEEFLVILDIGKLSFTVEAEQKLYDARTDTYTDTALHTTKLTNAASEVVTEMPYLEEVQFSAIITPTPLDVDGQVIQNIEYNFVGWYTDKSGEMLLVSTNANYRFNVADNTKYYAVFEYIKFSVRFECNDDFGTIVDVNGNPVNRSEVVTPGQSLLGTYIAKPLKGYKFVSWKVVYNFNDATNTTITKENIIENPLASFGEIHANIVCTPTFDKKNIAINVKANRLDTTDVTDKTQVQIGDTFGTEITVNTQTRTEVVVKAIAQNGYAFVNWAFDGVDESNYIVLKTNVYNQGETDAITGAITKVASKVHELYIEFIGDDIVTYNMIANFEIATVDLDVSFTTPGVDVVASGVIETEEGVFKGEASTFTAKTNSSLVLYLNVFKGFLLNDDEEKGKFYATDEDITVEFEDLSSTLTVEDKEIFDHRYKVTISNFSQSSKVFLYGNSKKINLHFAELLDFFENTYEEDVFQGYIRYYSSSVVLLEPEIPDDPEQEVIVPTLTPKFHNCIFVGWSTTQNSNNLVIDKNGVFIPKYWTILEDTNLYPIFEYASVKVDVTVAPLKALVNPYDYLTEVFSSTPEYMYMLSDNNYLFDIGASFGLNVPALKEKYHFEKFTYYVVDDNNLIKLVEYKKSDITINFADINLFNIPSMKAFEYSSALNFSQYSGLEDSVMYITIACSMDIDYKVENYYSSNREEVIGGGLDSPNLTNPYIASYGQEITLTAKPKTGYEVKEWWVNNRKLDTNAKTITFAVQEPTVFMVKFVGKQVEIKFNLIGAKSANFAGGNIPDSGEPNIRHVGDIINIFAEASVGFNFTDKWLHSNGGSLTTGQYIITAEDGEAETITLTPVCEERKLQVYIVLPLNLGVVEKDGKRLNATRNEQQITYLHSINYTDSINVTIKPLQRYKVNLVTLHANGNEIDVTEFVKSGNLQLSSELYNNASSLTIDVEITKTYWMDLITEQKLVNGQGDQRVFVTDFSGSGKQTDPYKITSIVELVQLAYAVNEDMIQTNTAFKNAYNRASTYYEIVAPINLADRFWSPIGTSQNPFNCNIVIYNMPANIQVDTEDPYYANSLFSPETLKQFSGLFGFLGDDATIELKIRDYYMIFVILAVLVVVILIIVFILVITHKIRHESVKNFDQKNDFLFDEE